LSPSGQLSSLFNGCSTCQIRFRGRLRVVCMHMHGEGEVPNEGVHARCPLRQ
jgi:hypothetical protein